MFIYTGNSAGKKLIKVEELGLGIMIASSPVLFPNKEIKKFPCALDNGAFQCYRRGFPFMPEIFYNILGKCYRYGITLDFIVCPDIVTGGVDSLKYSMKWAEGELETAQNLALAVQDGMEPFHIQKYMLDRFTHIFIGGSKEWKWSTAEKWVKFAHDKGKKCHIGRCGTLENLKKAYLYGADSVDSTNFVRNESWHIVEEFNRWKETLLFD